MSFELTTRGSESMRIWQCWRPNGNPTDDAATPSEERVSSIYSSAERSGCWQKRHRTVWTAIPRGWPVWQERKWKNGKKRHVRSIVYWPQSLMDKTKFRKLLEISISIIKEKSEIQPSYMFFVYSITCASSFRHVYYTCYHISLLPFLTIGFL
jgi:hypothetical protein